jgi:hypothetical protein
MKLHVDRADIERSGVGAETEFKIKTTAKAFDILSSGLYTDNILAIVRELSCNAYDAHVAAGKADVPFEIHLPNNLEPFFSVKDFGTGLSDDQVMSLYTTYFDSTKTESNEFIGALGLGSKSPFSYVKAFEVISRHDGVRRVYSVFINEDGVPTIARIGEPIPTDEQNGIEVKMTVKPEDFYRFSNKTSSALRWFPVKPIVVGEAHFTFNEPPETEIQGNGWYIYKERYSSGDMKAVQGNVEYRVDIHHIEEISDEVKAFLRTVNVIAFFDIGELEVAASREEIRYDKRTKEALAEKISDIHKKAMEIIEEKADDLTGGMWNAIIELDNLSASMFRDRSHLRTFVAGSEHPVLKAYVESRGHLKIERTDAHDMYTYVWGRYRNNLKRHTLGKGLTPSSNIAVFVNDLRNGGVGRLTQWLKQNSETFGELIVIIEKKTPVRMEDRELKDGGTETVPVNMTAKEVADEFKTIVNNIGNPTVRYVSRDTTAVQREAKTRMKAIFKYSDWQSNLYRAASVIWDRVEELDMDAGGLYFLLERGTSIKWNDKKINWAAREVESKISKITEVVNDHLGLEEDKYAYEDVIGVGAVDIKKFEKHPKWFNIFDLLAEAVPSYQAAAEARQKWEATPDVNGLKSAFKENKFMQRVQQLDKDSPFRRAVEKLRKASGELIAADLPYSNIVRQFDREYGNKEIHAVDVKGHIQENELEMYPMLDFVGDIVVGGWNATNIDVIFDYIETIDGSN